VRILFLHQNFPGQFLQVATALQQQSRHELLALMPAGDDRPQIIPVRTYNFDPRYIRTNVPLARHYTDRVARGAAVAKVLRELQNEGFTPDIVVGHGGWGETLFVRDIWPRCQILVYAEYFYVADGSDVDFDPAIFPLPADDVLRLEMRTRNASMTLALLDADHGIVPTAWQASLFPAMLRQKIAVLHEGIDTNLICPAQDANITLHQSGRRLRAGDEVITFVSRDLEPYRGYHVFMRALPHILQRRPNARAVIVGGDKVSYGSSPPSGGSWKDIFFDEVRERLDVERVHFVGKEPHRALLQLLRVSAAHVYLTYPFILSWSMLEAMSAGALVIGSRTLPVEEIITHGRNGILCDFFDVSGIADAVVDALAQPDKYRALRTAGRQTVVERFDARTVCVPAWLALLDRCQQHGTATFMFDRGCAPGRAT
jgi:glycosyltransferase involved in cell wall biosynthesis